MTQADRDRLVALRKAAKGLITLKQAAEELKITGAAGVSRKKAILLRLLLSCVTPEKQSLSLSG